LNSLENYIERHICDLYYTNHEMHIIYLSSEQFAVFVEF